MKFFRRKSKSPIFVPFTHRVATFWVWYAAQAERFHQTIEDNRCGELAKEVSEKVDELLPSLAWVFGPGPTPDSGHSFTLSPEGNKHRRLLTEFWLAQAPTIPGWTFYASRQPSPDFNRGVAVTVQDQEIRAEEVWVTPHPLRDEQLINLTAWHPAFQDLPENAAYQILFIMLDDALGEDAVENHIGDVHIRDDKLAKSFPVHELREEVQRIRANWESEKPRDAYQVYNLPEPDNSFMRSDTIVGSTRHTKLISEYLAGQGHIKEDPLADLGAQFVFLAFPTAQLPRGEEATKRGEIEDAIGSMLTSSHCGEVIGGATGIYNTYIDLLLFDPRRSTIDRIRDTIRPFQLKDAAAYAFNNGTGQPIYTL